MFETEDCKKTVAHRRT